MTVSAIFLLAAVAAVRGAPPAPTALSAVSAAGANALRWTPAFRASSHRLYRSAAAGGPYTQLAVVSPGTGSVFVDAAVVNGSVSFYVVRGVAPAGTEGPQSPETAARADDKSSIDSI